VWDQLTLKQMALIALDYEKNNPDELHLPASIVALKALNKSFPCKVDHNKARHSIVSTGWGRDVKGFLGAFR